jgi:hypothetical protein
MPNGTHSDFSNIIRENLCKSYICPLNINNKIKYLKVSDNYIDNGFLRVYYNIVEQY